MNCKNKSFMTKKKAFTLIELLIVIAIIGILFIVLVSKVDFATDKAKATGVQTDFRSFQMAFDTVAKENAGFNTFGWDTGDLNANGKRDSYDEGDNGAGGGTAHNGIQDGTEVFTGHKVYAETFTKVYSLVKPGTTGYDRDALNRLETAINANLDPKLHITIANDGTITMANGAQDPWNKEYHGWYITNAETDGKDRGAIVMYSDGANNEFGSAHIISDGKVTVTVPNSNKNGKDDYSIVSCYTYVNGYGEVLNMTTGFSNNQSFMAGGNGGTEPDINEPISVVPGATFDDGTTLSWEELQLDTNGDKYGYLAASITNTMIYGGTFQYCTSLTSLVIPDSVTSIGEDEFFNCKSLASITVEADNMTYQSIDGNLYSKDGKTLIQYAVGKTATSFTIPNSVTSIGSSAFSSCTSLESVTIPDSVTSIGNSAFLSCSSLTSITIPDSVTSISDAAFYNCSSLTSVTLGDTINAINDNTFSNCTSLTSIVIPTSVTRIGDYAFWGCSSLTSITYRGTNSQWSDISKDVDWHYDVPATYVQCSDVQVNLQ